MGIEFSPATIPPFFAFSFKEHVSTLIFIKYGVDVKSTITFHKLNNRFTTFWLGHAQGQVLVR